MEFVYCAVDTEGKIQWVQGSSTKTKYYATDKHITKAVEYHNRKHSNDPWKVQRFALVRADSKAFDSEEDQQTYEKVLNNMARVFVDKETFE